ncbi:MAG: hypothetical protein HYX78_07250 [Armatimonadetes bacterium]|nr:hypothetical protein [Armatimonadota bacterium]
MSLMGLDIGTTGVKAVVFDVKGNMLAGAYREYPLLFPFPGASELDPEEVIEAASEVIGEAASTVKGADPVTAIGIASQGEAFTPVDSGGRALANAMTSSDSRAATLVRDWREEYGVWLYEITGHTPYPMYSLFKLLWLKENRADVWKDAWKFLFFEDLLAFTLTGAAVTDYTVAARSMMFDVRNRRWSSEILELIGLERERLPDAVPSGTIIGTVRHKLCRDLGLASGAVVVAGGHDQPVGALGCGAAASGSGSYAVGTVECICPKVDRLIQSSELMDANLATYPHVLPDSYTTVAFNTMGGNVLRWVRDNLAIEETAEARRAGEDPYDRIISSASSEPGSVILLPHFGPTGTPHFESKGTGVLFGLKLSTTRAEVLRAFLEGITYEMKWNLSILSDVGFKLSDLRVIGGGAKSKTWMRIKADILGVPLTTMRVAEATCMGAAILAGSGLGIVSSRDASEEWAMPAETYQPRKEHSSIYEDRFAVYKEIYNSLCKARSMHYGFRN